MTDVQQTESGADQNALRYNIPVGESRVYEVAAVKQLPDGSYVIAAWVAEDDIDLDHCTVAEGVTPVKGKALSFEHKADGTVFVSEAAGA